MRCGLGWVWRVGSGGRAGQGRAADGPAGVHQVATHAIISRRPRCLTPATSLPLPITAVTQECGGARAQPLPAQPAVCGGVEPGGQHHDALPGCGMDAARWGWVRAGWGHRGLGLAGGLGWECTPHGCACSGVHVSLAAGAACCGCLACPARHPWNDRCCACCAQARSRSGRPSAPLWPCATVSGRHALSWRQRIASAIRRGMPHMLPS